MRDLWPLAVAAHALAAGAGVALWRRVREHAPVAFALTLLFAVGLAQKAREVWIVPPGRKLLADPPPYEGWQRVAFHAIEQAGELLTPAMVAWASLVVYSHPVWLAAGPRTMAATPQGAEPSAFEASGASRFWGLRLLGAWAYTLALFVLGYPELRRDALTRAYLGVHVASLLVGGAAAVALLRRARLRDLTVTHACALMIVGFAALDLLVGAWRYGLYGEAYRATQGGLLGLYLLLTFAQARALVRER